MTSSSRAGSPVLLAASGEPREVVTADREQRHLHPQRAQRTRAGTSAASAAVRAGGVDPALDELTAFYEKARVDPEFSTSWTGCSGTYAGRPSPLTDAASWARTRRRPLLLKREDLNHTSHKSTMCWVRRCWPSGWARPG